MRGINIGANSVVRLCILFFVCSISSNAFAQNASLDAPHDLIGCNDCHDMTAFDLPNLIPVNDFTPGPTIDDTLYNVTVCWKCHLDGDPAPGIQTHSSLQSSNKYGDWTVECVVCHDQHRQEQNDLLGTTYGMFIRKRIDLSKIAGLSKSGMRVVQFSGNSGSGSFAHSDGLGAGGNDSTPGGICQVCHDQTLHWKNDGTFAAVGVHANYNGEKCMWCHNHSQGFKADFPDHGVRINETAFCLTCHPGPEIVENTHKLTEPDIDCSRCHRPEDYKMQDYISLYLERSYPPSINCDECHYGQFDEHVVNTGLNGVHNNARLGYDKDDDFVSDDYVGCDACHYGDIVQEHSRGRAITCTSCHESGSAKVLSAISKGRPVADGGSDQFVFCDDCHNITAGEPSGNLVDQHHVTPYAENGDCSYCHVVGRGINGPVGGPCGDCHGDSRFAYRHTNAAMIDLDNVQDYRACFSCHLVGAQGYAADPEGDPPGDPGYTGTPVAEPMHALPVNPRHPGDLWNSDQCGYATCSDGVADLPLCESNDGYLPANRPLCDNFIEMMQDPQGYIVADPEGYIASLPTPEEKDATKKAIITLSKSHPGLGLFDYYFNVNFGAGGTRPYNGGYIPDDIIDGTKMDTYTSTAGTTMSDWAYWLRFYAGDDPSWQRLHASSSVKVPVNYDNGTGPQIYEVFSPDSSGTGGMVDGNGSLQVDIAAVDSTGAPAALPAGAAWRRDGLGWEAGNSIFGLRPREYRVEFKKLGGWVTPENITSPVEDGNTTILTGTYMACSDTPALTISDPGTLNWNSPDQIEIFTVTGWRGNDIEWSLDTGTVTGFRLIPISPTRARLEKTGASTESIGNIFRLSAKGSDCYGNTASLEIPVDISAAGAQSPEISTQDGMIGDTVVNTLDVGFTAPSDLIHVDGMYYAQADSDGNLRTFKVDSSGQISLVDEKDDTEFGFTYQEAQGTEPTQWYSFRPDILHVSGNVYVVAIGRMLRTVSISPDGLITVLNNPSNSLYISNSVLVTDIFKATGDVYIVVYGVWGKVYYMQSVRIADDGQMSLIDGPWNFDNFSNHNYGGTVFDIESVGPDTYAMIQLGNAGAPGYPNPKPGFIRTFTLGSDGALPSSFIDTYEFDKVELGNFDIFKLDESNNYGILYRTRYKGTALKTIPIKPDGTIGLPINTMFIEHWYSTSGSGALQISDEIFAFFGTNSTIGETGTYAPIMLKTYRIKNGLITPEAIDYFRFAATAWWQATFVDMIHVVDDYYVIANGSNDLFTVAITSDDDGDGVLSLNDNCLAVANPSQADSDGDGIGDSCDTCPNDPANDVDRDGICEDVDPCPGDPDNSCGG